MTIRKAEALIEVRYELVMNLLYGKEEDFISFSGFSTREMAIEFYRSFRVEPYEERGFCAFSCREKMYKKYFAKDSPLENLSPLSDDELNGDVGPFNFGIHEILVRVISVDLDSKEKSNET